MSNCTSGLQFDQNGNSIHHGCKIKFNVYAAVKGLITDIVNVPKSYDAKNVAMIIPIAFMI